MSSAVCQKQIWSFQDKLPILKKDQMEQTVHDQGYRAVQYSYTSHQDSMIRKFLTYTVHYGDRIKSELNAD